MVDLLLFPSSFFTIQEVDEDLQREYDAVCSTGMFDTVLFAYDQWFNEGKLLINTVPTEERLAVYRGWMMKPEQYELFYDLLLEHKVRLVTEPEQYRLMHLFPLVYEAIKEDTPKMILFPLHAKINVEQVKKSFRRFMVKDFVKSVKGTEFPLYFDQSITQEEFDHWMDSFYKYRGNLLTGGICIKEFVDLKKYGAHTNEYRVFYINHQMASVFRNSGQWTDTPGPPRSLLEKYENLGSPYYTVDYAELDDGSWKILETGDGQVSGLSEGQDYEQYYRTLHHCFNERNC